MKFFVVSDIHGDSYWAQRAVDTFVSEGADRLVLLGDILYHGPRNDLPENYNPKKVIEIFNGYADRILAVRGNCEAEVDQMVLKFPCMADYAYIVSGETVFFATHGHIYNEQTLQAYISKGTVVLSGHTHVTVDEVRNGIRYMNPGSPSIPKEGSKPSYIVIDDGQAVLKEFT
ncbi:MAG: phosphodiesterase [Clostridiales bacterium]|nr:phosphodiesterase [Clostridiales bacterium]